MEIFPQYPGIAKNQETPFSVIFVMDESTFVNGTLVSIEYGSKFEIEIPLICWASRYGDVPYIHFQC